MTDKVPPPFCSFCGQRVSFGVHSNGRVFCDHFCREEYQKASALDREQRSLSYGQEPEGE